MNKQNVPVPPEYSQVCIWPGTLMEESQIPELESMFLSEGFRIKFLEVIFTNPDKCPNGHIIPGTGGRSDIFFGIHHDDIPKFAGWRFKLGIRWIEDALATHNHSSHLYPERVKGYCTWDATITPEEVEMVKARDLNPMGGVQ